MRNALEKLQDWLYEYLGVYTFRWIKWDVLNIIEKHPDNSFDVYGIRIWDVAYIGFIWKNRYKRIRRK